MIAANCVVLFLALVLDRIVGDPKWFWARIPHPVVVFGRAIAFFEAKLNRAILSDSEKRRNGVFTIVFLLVLTVATAWLLHRFLLRAGWLGWALEIGLAAIFLAQKSLVDHVRAVAKALHEEGLEGGRLAVSQIVGRDPKTLDEPAVCRAAIESLAENFSDGVVAPVFWGLLLGLPGIAAYKMLNTADSMIGHKSQRYFYFGWAAARLDDAANWLPARFSMLLIAGGAFMRRGSSSCLATWQIAWRDGKLHRSPNSGRPEAAMAGALDLQLAGPRIYAGERVNESIINKEGKGKAVADDIEAGITVFNASCDLLLVLICALFAVSVLV